MVKTNQKILPQAGNFLPVKQLPEIKLKDRPANRSRLIVKMKEVFGFLPEVMMIDKVPGQNNTIKISVVLTPEEVEKEKNAKK